MSTLLLVLFSSLRSSLQSRAALQAEILALRHQLLVLQNHGCHLTTVLLACEFQSELASSRRGDENR
jgi:hypothetical protein